MEKYCLIGERISYSLSPIMHNTLFEMGGIDAKYSLLECQKEELEQVAQSIREHYKGANVTVPYKTAIIPFLDEVTGNAVRCGAVNTIINKDGMLIGDCTDGEGFLRAVDIPLKNERVLLYGSGGAARAILASLLGAGAVVDIVNRTRSSAADMLNSLAKAGCDCFNARIVDAPMQRYRLTVNATPLGGVKYPDQSPELCKNIADAGLVYDCVYSPNPTLILKTAARGGAECRNGLSMLLWQGVLAQELWGHHFDEKTVQAAYSIMQKENEKA